MPGWLLDLLFPPKCVFCGRLTEKGDVCPACRDKLPVCGRVSKKGEFYSACAAAFWYEGDVRASLLRYKFGGRKWYAACYADFLANTIENGLAGRYDTVSWVPVSRRRLRKRGYDQARLLAEKTAEKLGAPVMETLFKAEDNPPQSGIKGDEKRRANVLDVYKPAPGADVSGKRVLLVDDIVTTGSTLSECARTLRMAGAEEVCCAVVAAARRDGF